MIARSLVLAAVAALAAPLAAAETAAAPPPTPLPATAVAPATTWDRMQYVGADAKGRIFLLRTDGFEVYPLEKDGELGEPERLQAAPLAGPEPVLDAAMDRHGDWVAVDGDRVRWFRNGKEIPLPALGFPAAAVELVRGEPVAAVFPTPIGHVDGRETAEHPYLLVAGKDEWHELVASGVAGLSDPPERMRLRQAFAARLAADSRGTLWLAHHYRYRLVHYTAGGRELLTLEVGGGEVAHRDEEAAAEVRAVLEEEKARYSEPERATITVNTALPMILDLAEGRDGRIYLLVKGEGRGALLLDRFDPVRAVLERTPIAATSPGAVSLAAGRDGLYLVPFNGRATRWKIAWEDVEAAAWQPVEVVINDLEAVPEPESPAPGRR